MNARMGNPALIVPGALDALLALGKAAARRSASEDGQPRAAARQSDQRV